MTATTIAPPAERGAAREPETAESPAPSQAPPDRLLALDVFRGMTVAGMLLVNNPGTWSAIYPPLQHASWHGWTPTDLIFPFFLFIVGVTTHLSLSARRARAHHDALLVRQIVKRGTLIVLFGLLLAAFPYVPVERITGVRFPGVLQRIGVAYVVGALLTLRTTLRQQILILVGLLYGYWFAMTLLPVPGRGMGALLLDDPSASLAAWLDRAVFGSHLWRSARTWDPEGILSTVPAAGTVVLGVLAGRWLTARRDLSERLVGLYGAGSVLMVLGLMWHWSFPINKNLWSSSYVVFTAGMAAVVLATCLWVVDGLRVRRWTAPFVAFGVNPLIAFIGSGMMARLIYSVITVPYEHGRAPIQRVLYERWYASWLEPRDASLLFAFTFVLVWAGLLSLLQRRRIMFRV
jgi:predicted acyltransferase